MGLAKSLKILVFFDSYFSKLIRLYTRNRKEFYGTWMEGTYFNSIETFLMLSRRVLHIAFASFLKCLT